MALETTLITLVRSIQLPALVETYVTQGISLAMAWRDVIFIGLLILLGSLFLLKGLLRLYRFFFSPIYRHYPLPKNHKGKHYAIEKLPPPFPNAWFGVMMSHELEPGQAKEIQMVGKTLAVFRTEDGAVSALDAYCPHLGANLSDGRVVNGGCLQCPFHGWVFDTKGTVVDIPYSETKQPTFVKARSYPTKECNGLIFVYFSSDDKMTADVEPPWELPVNPKIAKGTGYRFMGYAEHYSNAHLIEHPENGADIAHFNFLHGAFLFRLLQPILQHEWSAQYSPNKEKPHIVNLSVKHSFKLFGRFLLGATENKITQYGPGFVQYKIPLAPFGEMFLFEITTPQQALRQKVIHTCWASRFVPLFLAKIAFSFVYGQFERDIDVWNRKTFVDKPPVMKEESTIVQFRRWFSQFFDEKSVSAADALRAEAIKKACAADW